MLQPQSIALSVIAVFVGVASLLGPLTHSSSQGFVGVNQNRLGYAPESWEYLLEVGSGLEYGNSTRTQYKWAEDVKIKVYGTPTHEDIQTLDQVVSELNDLIDTVELQVTEGEANLEIYFLQESQFASLEPEYIPVNLGFFRVWWNYAGVIKRGRILIASQGITQRERSHLIREELTQSMGLFKDSWRHPDSIFYQGWSDSTEYSELDRSIINLLYTSRSEASTRGRAVTTLAASRK